MEIVYHSRIALTNGRIGSGVAVNWLMTSSIPNRNVRMLMRTLTSHSSHNRSSNIDCMSSPILPDFSAGLAQGGEYVIRCWRLPEQPVGSLTRLFCCLARQFRDHREQRHVKRNHDTAHTQAEDADNDWL